MLWGVIGSYLRRHPVFFPSLIFNLELPPSCNQSNPFGEYGFKQQIYLSHSCVGLIRPNVGDFLNKNDLFLKKNKKQKKKLQLLCSFTGTCVCVSASASGVEAQLSMSDPRDPEQTSILTRQACTRQHSGLSPARHQWLMRALRDTVCNTNRSSRSLHAL